MIGRQGVSSLGTVVLGGNIFEIDAITIISGAFRIFWKMYGPVQPFEGHITVYGEDGIGSWQGSYWELVSEIPEGTCLDCNYELRVSYLIDQHVFRINGAGDRV